jgi:hypothetical protein
VSPVASVGSSCTFLFIFDLLCKRFLPCHLVSVQSCGFIYKAGQKRVSRENVLWAKS